MTPPTILSIQSHVAFGHVGNAAAVFPLQRLGFEVWPVMTVQFSNHTGYGDWAGEVFTSSQIHALVEGLDRRGAFEGCAAVLSGYLGDAALGDEILRAVDLAKAKTPGALYCCDPVMGDVGRGLFVREGIPAFLRERALPAADIITPNQFELELLTGIEIKTLDDALAGARAARKLGPKIVLVTSLRHAGTPADRIEMLALSDGGAWIASTPLLRLDPAPNGAGDAVAALFLAHYLKQKDTPAALQRASAAIHGLLVTTQAAGSRELQLVAAQNAFDGVSGPVDIKPLS